MRHIVFFSGGIGSYAAAKRVAMKYGTGTLTLLFTDTLMEDEDLYRFLEQTANSIGAELVKLQEGRDPWQVFSDERYLGNTRADPCSKILKRRMSKNWVRQNCQPHSTILYLGIDWTEQHRTKSIRAGWAGWNVQFPMCEKPLISKQQMLNELASDGIEPPRLYGMGFPHNNCGGFCIKAGQAHFRLLLEKMPERYAYHEQKEREIREYLGKDVAILRDRRGSQNKTLTLEQLRQRESKDCDMAEWGGCGCFVDEDPAGGDGATSKAGNAAP